MTFTSIFANPAAAAMRALVLSVLDGIKWRHHGIGVLQGYLRENVEPEVRIHIWSRRLLKPGMDVSGDSHDHRFDMVSHVLCGNVEHEELIETPDPVGDHALMTVTHARAAADTKYHGPTMSLDGRFSVVRKRYTIREGWSYSFPSRHFHRSPVPMEGLAVTCVEKHQQQDAPGRLIYPVTHEPVMAFGHDPDPETIKAVVSVARKRLEKGTE